MILSILLFDQFYYSQLERIRSRNNLTMGGQKIVFLVVSVLIGTVLGKPTYQPSIPNGKYGANPNNQQNEIVNGGTLNAFGHKASSFSVRSQFGRDFASNSYSWVAICNLDSDGDGLTNGEELGDPNCEFTPGNDADFDYQSDPTDICDPACPTPAPTTGTPTDSPTPAPVTEPLGVGIAWFVPSEFPDLVFSDEYFISEDDNIFFLASGDSNIIQYSTKEDFDSCSDNFTVLVASVTDGENVSSVDVSGEKMYLSSSTSNGESTHCELGQKITIQVFAPGVEIIADTWAPGQISPIEREPADVIEIFVGGAHDLYQFPDLESFTNCVFDNATLIYDGADGAALIRLRDSTAAAGTKTWYGCRTGTHCIDGQKLTVSIIGAAVSDDDPEDDDDDDDDGGLSFNSTPANVLMLLTGVSLAVGISVMVFVGKFGSAAAAAPTAVAVDVEAK